MNREQLVLLNKKVNHSTASMPLLCCCVAGEANLGIDCAILARYFVSDEYQNAPCRDNTSCNRTQGRRTMRISEVGFDSQLEINAKPE